MLRPKGRAVTDWTGAEIFWFYAQTEADTYINVAAAVDNEYSGEVQGYFNSEAAGLKYYVEEDGAFVEKATTEDTWKHIFLPAGYDGWVGFDLSQMVCRSGHLTEQDFTAHLGDVYGIGFYMEGGPLAVTDFRADGIAGGSSRARAAVTAAPVPVPTAPAAVGRAARVLAQAPTLPKRVSRSLCFRRCWFWRRERGWCSFANPRRAPAEAGPPWSVREKMT